MQTQVFAHHLMSNRRAEFNKECVIAKTWRDCQSIVKRREGWVSLLTGKFENGGNQARITKKVGPVTWVGFITKYNQSRASSLYSSKDILVEYQFQIKSL